MTGHGRAGGAATVVNAFATGKGCAFGLAFSVEARVESSRRSRVWSNGRRLPPREARLALEAARAIQRRFHAPEAVDIHVESAIPPRKGLKSSSAVGVAVARAAADHVGRRATEREILASAADAGLASRTSLTGAYDDASACLLGGVVFTDNARRRILRRDQLPGDLVALVRVPRASIATGALRRAAFRPAAPLASEAWRLALGGRYRQAMLVNTLAYAPILGLHPTFTLEALDAGAYAAGLSGKGPAEVALVHRDQLARFRRFRRETKIVALRGGGSL